MFIVKEEEEALGILEHDTVDWRPDSDGVESGQTRKRSDTVSTLILIVMTKKGAA